MHRRSGRLRDRRDPGATSSGPMLRQRAATSSARRPKASSGTSPGSSSSLRGSRSIALAAMMVECVAQAGARPGRAARSSRPPPPGRSCLVLEVGIFASRWVDHVVLRDLLPVVAAALARPRPRGCRATAAATGSTGRQLLALVRRRARRALPGSALRGAGARRSTPSASSRSGVSREADLRRQRWKSSTSLSVSRVHGCIAVFVPPRLRGRAPGCRGGRVRLALGGLDERDRALDATRPRMGVRRRRSALGRSKPRRAPSPTCRRRRGFRPDSGSTPSGIAGSQRSHICADAAPGRLRSRTQWLELPDDGLLRTVRRRRVWTRALVVVADGDRARGRADRAGAALHRPDRARRSGAPSHRCGVSTWALRRATERGHPGRGPRSRSTAVAWTARADPARQAGHARRAAC